jgi:ATP-dependent helicase HrpB
LLDHVDQLLTPQLAGCRTRADLAGVDVALALRALLPWPLAGKLDELAPERLMVPSGAAHRVDYSVDPPVLAVRLQEVFGLAVGPTVGGGRVPVVLHLLSPAQRPVAVTGDLASFWAGPYLEVRKELRGRYPKHSWPLDPLAALPTRRVTRPPAD